jgi:formylglycine-generating enzyme required for sulfatase activity
MCGWINRATILLAVVAMAVPLCQAKAFPDKPKKLALLVGVDEYKTPILADKPLRYAQRDVIELGKVLRAQNFDDVKILTGAAATRAGINAALDALLKDPGAEDLILVGFSGHGAQMSLVDAQGRFERDEQGNEKSEAYFCPVDAVLGRPQTMVGLTALMARLNRESGIKLMLVDACRDDPVEAGKKGLRSLTGDELVGRLAKDSVIVLACSAGQRALETDKAGNGHGVFFHHVIEGLNGKAADPETGEVLWDDLVTYLRKNVNKRAREWDPDNAARVDASPRTRGRLQDPHVVSNLIATPLLARVDVVRRLPENLPMPLPKPSVSAEVITSRFTGMKLRLIPAGTFMMGSPDSDKEVRDDEKPAREVIITRGFYLGETEVTQGQYKAVTGENPSVFKGSDNLPAEEVSWLEAVKYANALSEKDGLTPFYQIKGESATVPDWKGEGYRLPTEAEWEYACRAPKKTGRYGFGDDAAMLGEYAWFEDNVGGQPQEVRQKRANGFGLFDMHGNVREWCWDVYVERLSGGVDPRVSNGLKRVIRGGSWSVVAGQCRAAYRGWGSPASTDNNLGFRLARGSVR